MNPQELRISNLLQDKFSGTILEVEYISTQSFGTKVLDRSKFPLPEGWEADPIPLTEQWLIDFGFYKKEDAEGWYKYGICFYNGFMVTPQHKKIGYVHQLQNLYFALTGEELQL